MNTPTNSTDIPLDPDLLTAEGPNPLLTHLGMRMVGWDQGRCRFEIPMQEFLMNRFGIPHGGVQAALLDTVMGYAGAYTGDPNNKQMVMTLSLNINYLSQARGDTLIGEGWRSGGGRKTFFAEGRVLDNTGEVLATGTGVFRYRSGS